MVIGDELGDKAEVGNLRSGPAKLEDDNEGPVVEEGGPLRRGRPTAQAGAEDEGEGEQDAGGACRWQSRDRSHRRTSPQWPRAPWGVPQWEENRHRKG